MTLKLSVLDLVPVRTDQTSGLRDEDSAAPLPVMNALLPAFHAAGA